MLNLEEVKTVSYLRDKHKWNKKVKQDGGIILTRYGRKDVVVLDFEKYAMLKNIESIAKKI